MMQAVHVAVWFFAVECLGIAAFPLAALALPLAPDRGFGVAKVLGLLLVGYFAWLLPALGVLPFTGGTVALGAVLLGVGGFLAARRLPQPFLTREVRRQILGCEAVYVSVFLAFAAFRAFEPEIFWGEKPMDFTFLNYFVRFTHFPITDPWAAGQSMHYYYLGTYLFAALHKLTLTPTAVGYNLSLVTVAALLAAASYCVVAQLTRRRWAAAAGGIFIVALANMEVFRLVLFGGSVSGFNLYWASSRVLQHAMANEYPLWSILFGDLHAHVIALPFTVVTAAFAVSCLRKGPRHRSRPVFWALYALVWGSLLVINSWDFISYGALTFVALVAMPRAGVKLHRPAAALWADRLTATLAFGGLALALVYPSLESLAGNAGAHGWTQKEFDTLGQVLRHLWQFLLPVLLIVTFRARRHGGRWSIALALAALPLLTAAFTATRPPWELLALTSLLVGLSAALLFGKTASHGLRGIALLTLVASLLIAVAELFWLLDRMNTLFKIYCAVWTLLSLATAASLPYLIAPLRRAVKRRRLTVGLTPFVACAVCFLIAAAGSFVVVGIVTTFHRVRTPVPTLDGTSYLALEKPDEKALIDWIQGHVDGVPVEMEAQGDPYGPYTRISMNTGLPTVLGWPYHVMQRGTPSWEVENRRQDIDAFYMTRDLAQAREILDRYDVKYVIVGELERKRFSAQALGKLDTSDLFHLAFRKGEEAVYEVRR